MRRLALAASVLGTSLAVGGPAVAQDPAPAVDRQLLALVDRTPWVGDGMDFTLQFRVEDAPTGAQVRLTVHDRITSRSAFARSLEGAGLRRSVSGPPEAVPLATLDADGDGIVQSTVPLTTNLEGAVVVPITAPGVYPVVVDLLDEEDEVLDTLRTHLVRLAPFDEDAELDPLGVAVVIPFRAPPAHLDPAGPEAPELPVEALAGVLADHPGVPVNLVPTPESIAAAAAADPTTVAALAAALSGSQVLRGPWVAVDEAAWERTDDAELARLLGLGDETLRRFLDARPDATRLAPAGFGPDQLAALVEHGARAAIVAEDDVEALDDDDFPYTLARPFRIGLGPSAEEPEADGRSIPALASDRALVELAAEAETDPILAAHHVLADLAVIARDEPESARVATLVLPEVAVSPAFLDELLDGLEPPSAPPVPPPPPANPEADPALPPETSVAIPAASPIVAATTVADALRTVEPAGADGGADAEDPLVRPVTADADVSSVGPLAETVAARRADLASYRAVFGPADPLGDRIEDVLATLTSSELDSGARRAALTAVDEAMAAQLAGLHGPERQQVTLTAREGRVQLLLTNDTGRPADVTLLVRGDRLVFPDAASGRLDVHLAGPTTRLDLRVETRSSGDAPIDIQLTSPDERLDLGQSRITVRATAVSGVGILLMAAAAAFLLAWWTRTILRDRRAGRSRPARPRSGPAHARR